MPPLQRLQMGRVERLSPDADPVHPACAECVHELRRNGLRIALDRELLEARQIKRLAQRQQQVLPQLHPKQTRSPPTNKDGFERSRVWGQRRQFPLQSLHKWTLSVPRVHDAVEIAVVALV